MPATSPLNLAPATDPVVKRVENYNGVTDANGLWTVVHTPAFPATPDLTTYVSSDNPDYTLTLVSQSASGFQVKVQRRSTATVVGITVIVPGWTVVSGASVAARAQEK